MRKRLCICLVACALCLTGFAGCKKAPKTTVLNTVSKFFSNETLLESTARELTIDGQDAEVRIHIMNLGSDPIDGFGVNVGFLDAAGNVLYTDTQRVQFEVALESYEGTSVTASCSGKDVGKIVGVSISGTED